MELTPELVGVLGVSLFGLVSWFCNRVTNQLDAIHTDLKGYSDRLTKMETKFSIKCGEHH
jgi:hypothetical protein